MRVKCLLACVILSTSVLMGGCANDVPTETEPAPDKAEDPWEVLGPAIFECNIRGDMAFHSTVTYLQTRYLHDQKWHYHSKAATSKDFTAKSRANVLIEGNCTSTITLSDGGMIHIKGDLTGELDVKGLGEIIIAGEISREALIKTDGIVRVLVGADVNGKLINIGSSTYFIRGNLNGNFVTGDPSTYLYVYGDCHASFAHYGDHGSGLQLIVEGYMPLDNMKQLQKLRYTEVLAFIHESNQPRGIRPTYGQLDQHWYVKTEKSP